MYPDENLHRNQPVIMTIRRLVQANKPVWMNKNISLPPSSPSSSIFFISELTFRLHIQPSLKLKLQFRSRVKQNSWLDTSNVQNEFFIMCFWLGFDPQKMYLWYLSFKPCLKTQPVTSYTIATSEHSLNKKGTTSSKRRKIQYLSPRHAR